MRYTGFACDGPGSDGNGCKTVVDEKAVVRVTIVVKGGDVPNGQKTSDLCPSCASAFVEREGPLGPLRTRKKAEEKPDTP